MSSRFEVTDRSDVDAMMMLDPDTLESDKHYRFCQERGANQARRRSQGYEPVLRSEHGVSLLSEFQDEKTTADDLIRVGDCILMQCDKETYKARERGKKSLTDMRLGAHEQSFKERAARKGVETVSGERTKGEPKS